jgi:hypothetical protein
MLARAMAVYSSLDPGCENDYGDLDIVEHRGTGQRPQYVMEILFSPQVSIQRCPRDVEIPADVLPCIWGAPMHPCAAHSPGSPRGEAHLSMVVLLLGRPRSGAGALSILLISSRAFVAASTITPRSSFSPSFRIRPRKTRFWYEYDLINL